MAFAVGTTVPLLVNIVGTDGVTPTDPATIAVTVTKPDQTTAVYTYPATMSRISVGKFQANHLITARGLHGWTGVSTGPSAVYGPDSFYGSDPGIVPIVSLADVRTQLRAFSTASDAQLSGWAVTATVLAEQYTHHIWATRSFTETHQGGKPTISLFQLPAQSITTVIEEGLTLVAGSDYSLDSFGILWRGPLQGFGGSAIVGSGQIWQSISAPITVTYVAGPAGAIVPDNMRLGALEMCQHLAMSTRGGSGRPNQASSDVIWAPGMTFPIPRRVAGFWTGSKGAGL